MADVAEKLFAVFAATDASGKQLYAVDDLRHFLPWVLVNMPIDFAGLDDDTVAIFAETCGKAGVGADDSGEVLTEKLAAYYEENPPNPQLRAALETAWRDVQGTTNAGGAANPFAKFSGAAKSTAPVDTGGKRPEGTAPAALARFSKIPPKK